MVESLIGVSFLAGGLADAIRLIALFGMISPSEWKLSSPMNNVYYDDFSNRSVQALEERLGYSFSDKSLAQQSITHSSSNKGKSYERLEFLGDAVLDCLVLDHFYRL